MTRGSSHHKKNTRRKKYHKSLLDKIQNDALNAGARTSRSHATKVIESRDDEEEEDAEASFLSLSSSHGSSSIGLSRFASDSVSCVKTKKVSFDDRFSYISFDAFEASYGDDETHHASRFDEVSRGRSTVPWWWALGHESVEDSSLMDDEGNSIQRKDVSRSPRCQDPSFEHDHDMLLPRTQEPDGHRVESCLSCESWISEIGQEVELDLDDQTECSGDHSALSRGTLNYQPEKHSLSEDKGGCVHLNTDVYELGVKPNQPESNMNLSKRAELDIISQEERTNTNKTKSTSTASQLEHGAESNDKEPRQSEVCRKTVAGTKKVLRNGIVDSKEQKCLLNRSLRKKSQMSTFSEDGLAESSTTIRSTTSNKKCLKSKPSEESIIAGGRKFGSTVTTDKPKRNVNLSERAELDNISKNEGRKTGKAKSTSTASQLEHVVQSEGKEPTLSEVSRTMMAGTRTGLRNDFFDGKEEKGLLNRSLRKKSQMRMFSEDGAAESSTTTRSTIPNKKCLVSKPSEESIVAGGSKFGSVGAPNQSKSSKNLSKQSGLDSTSQQEGRKTSRTKSTFTTLQLENNVQSEHMKPTLSEVSRKTVAGTRTVLKTGIIDGKEEKGLLNKSLRKKSQLNTSSEDVVAENSTITRSAISDTKCVYSKPSEESFVAGGSMFSRTTNADTNPRSTISTEKTKKTILQKNLIKLSRLSLKANDGSGGEKKQLSSILPESKKATTLTPLSKSLGKKAMRKSPLLGLKQPMSSVSISRNEKGSVETDVNRHTSMMQPSKPGHTSETTSGTGPEIAIPLDTVGDAPSILPLVPKCTRKINSPHRIQPPIIVNNDDSNGGISPPHVRCSLRLRTVIDNDAQDTREVEIYFQPTLDISVISDVLPSEVLEELPTKVAAEQSKTGLAQTSRERTVERFSEKIYSDPLVDKSCSVIGVDEEIQSIPCETPAVNINVSGITSKVSAGASVTAPNEPDVTLSLSSTGPHCQSARRSSNRSVTESTDSTLQAGAAPLSSVIDHVAFESPTQIEFPGRADTFPESLITEKPPHENPTPPKRTLIVSPRALWVKRKTNQTPVTMRGEAPFSTLSTFQENSCSRSSSVDQLALVSLTRKEFPNKVEASPESLIPETPPHENPKPQKFSLITSPRALWVKGKSKQEVLYSDQPISVTTAAGEPFSALPTCHDNSSLDTNPAHALIRNKSTQSRIESTGFLAPPQNAVEQLATVDTSLSDQGKGARSPSAVPECLSASSTSTASTKSQHSTPKLVKDRLQMVPPQAISWSGSNLVRTDVDALQNGSAHANTSPQHSQNKSLSKLLQSSASQEYILEDAPNQAVAGVSKSIKQTCTESLALIEIPESQSSSSKSQQSQQSGLNEEDPTHSFESILTLDWDLFDDISDLKTNGFRFLCKKPICQKIDIQCDDHIRAQSAGLENANSHHTEINHFGILCKHPKLERLEIHNDDDEFVEGAAACPMDEHKPKFNIAAATYEAICHCVGHEQFSDILMNPIRVDDSLGLGFSKETKRTRKIKKKKKPKKLLTPINEEDMFPASGLVMNFSMSDAQASPHQHSSLPASTEHECPHPVESDPVDLRNDPFHAELFSHVPTKKKTLSMFTLFGRKKKLKGKDEKDVLTLIQSDAFMASIMKEIQLEARFRTQTSDFSCNIEKNNDDDGFDFPDAFSEMLIKRIAEEAVKKCLEDLNEPAKHDE